MFLVFSKEFRELESLMSDLRKKLKKSEKFESDGYFKFNLDTIDIFFKCDTPSKFTVKDKSGKEIVSMNWDYDPYNEMQQAISNQVHNLLSFARKTYDKRVEKKNKLKEAAATTKKALEAKQKQKMAEQAKISKMANALDRLRDL